MTFDDEREQARERKFANDQELALKVAVRRNAMLARWAVARMGLHGGRADAYVKNLIEGDIVNIDPQAVALRVMADLLGQGVPVDREELDALIARFTARARAEVVRGAFR